MISFLSIRTIRSAVGSCRSRLVLPASVLCALFLLVAAALKLYGLGFSPYGQYGRFASPALQTVAVVWEVLLGIWLLSGVSRFLSWVAAVATFLAFALISAYLGFIGQASCGCFGTIQASPWAAFALDLSALLVLAIGRPAWSGWKAGLDGLVWIGAVAATLLVLGAVATARFGSADAAVARLRGESLGVSPAFLDFGTGSPGESVTQQVTVHNWSSVPVRLYGGTTDCTCLATLDLPVWIQPGEQVDVSVQMKVPQASPGLLTRTVEFFTDCRAQPTLRLRAGCRVKE